jgi:fatty-acyl-CoA synthase
VAPAEVTTTLADVYRRWASRPGDDLVAVLVDRGRQRHVTRREVTRAVAGASIGMRALGVGPGDRVVIAHPTSLEFLAAFWATQLIGAIAVPAWPPPVTGKLWGAARLRRVLACVDARAVCMDESAHRRLETESWPSLPPLVPAAEADGPAEEPTSRPGPDDVALLQFTSGSTSAPRGCALDHRAVVGNVARLADRFGVEPREAGVVWCPLHHDMGLIGGVVFPVFRDVTSVLQRPEDFMANPLSWLRLMAQHRAVITTAPNFALALVNRKLRGNAPDLDLSHLRQLILGGEPIGVGVVREFLDTLAPCRLAETALHPAYGLSEHVVLAASSPGGVRLVSRPPRATPDTGGDDDAPGRAGPRLVVSLGRPLPGTEIRIARDGRRCDDGEAGEVHLRSASLMRGYWQDEQATSDVTSGGWLRTGDLGFMQGGELYVLGRVNEVIIVAGRNVPPGDVEAAAASVPGVRAGSVAACGTEQDGTQGVLVLAEYRGTDAVAARRYIAAACRRDLDLVPRKVVLVRRGTLPKTTSGKIRRLEARRLYEAGAMTDRFDDG